MLQLKANRVVPQRHAATEIAGVGVNGTAVSNVVGGVGASGAQDTLADD